MPPSAAEILQETLHAYDSCSSYRDQGQAAVSFDNEGEQVQQRLVRPFSTYFCRPNRFRFEFTNAEFGQEHRYVVWSDGEVVRSWWSLRPTSREFSSILEALAGPTGVSLGSAFRIPSLLLRHDWPERLIDLTPQSEVAGTETVGGAECFVLDQVRCGRMEVTLLVDVATRLIREARSESSFDGRSEPEWRSRLMSDPKITDEVKAKVRRYSQNRPFRSRTTTSYYPETDVDIGPEKFEFTPPFEARD